MLREQRRETVTIESLGASGWGLARLSNGRKVRVPGVSIGERHVIDAFRTFKGWQGRSIMCERSAPQRLKPDCEYHGLCGGCTHRHLSESTRIETLKADLIRRTEKAGFGGCRTTVVNSVPRTGYRNRAIVQPVRDHDSTWHLRFGRTPSFDGVELEMCLTQSPGIRALCEKVCSALGDEHEPYSDEEQVGSLRHIILATTDLPNERGNRVIFAFHGHCDLNKFERLKSRLIASIDALELFIDELPKRNAGLQSKPILQHRTATFLPKVGGRDFTVSPTSWWTQTPLSVPGLIATLDRFIQLSPDDRVVEIGCGVGTVRALLNTPCESWIGIDHERSAIDDAKLNVDTKALRTAFYVGDGTHWLRKLSGRAEVTCLLIHAMRLPFGSHFMKLAQALQPSRCVYIAPNPTSLFRDLEQLTDFELTELVLIDHTPGSGHYLTVALLSQSV
ncbi:MAG: hypothetical protein ACPGQS_10815 [Bradymonadia bacterium]